MEWSMEGMVQEVLTLALDRFGVDPDRGFLPSTDPAHSFGKGVHPYLKRLEELGDEIPELLESHRLRKTLESLEPPPSSVLDDLRGDKLVTATRIYAFLASAYVHQIGEQEAKRIPEGVAVPFSRLSLMMDRTTPILSYDLYCLNNWRRLDPNGSIRLENLDTIQKFVRIHDEPWFILIHAEIECKAAPAIGAIGRVQQAVLEGRPDRLEEGLTVIGASLASMIQTLKRMPENNSPDVYAFAFRPYIQMFTQVSYAGVRELAQPQTFRGETGAQSSIIPSLDKALGVKHQRTDLTEYVEDMLNYMPEGHRRFIRAIDAEERKKPIRSYIEAAGSKSLIREYNTCLERISEFRQQHLEFAISYIQSKVKDESGTGGTPFMKWLAQLKSETTSAMIQA
jgi:indoleamine 2,3-dioxygenase